MLNRAVQFQPFDALKGFKEALREVEKIKEDKKDFMDDYFISLNKKIYSLKKEDKVLVKYYYNLEYIETIDNIKKIDFTNKNLYLKNCKINFEDIIYIDVV